MTKLEIACVICGLIGILIYQPTKIKVEKNNVSDIFMCLSLIIKDLVFLAMIILPLYFGLWRK